MFFVGNDWAEDHHDVEIVDEQGHRLARRRVPEGLDGVTRLHGLIAQFVPEEWGALDPADAAARVKVGIETDRGVWVQALIAAGYEVSRSTHVGGLFAVVSVTGALARVVVPGAEEASREGGRHHKQPLSGRLGHECSEYSMTSIGRPSPKSRCEVLPVSAQPLWS